MDKKQKITGYLMMAAGMTLFLRILIRFFLQGYFTNEQIVFYLVPFEMSDNFGTLIFSLLFALSGYFLAKRKHDYTLFLCQFSTIGVIIDRMWFIQENVGVIKALSFRLPLLVCLFCILYWIVKQTDFDYKLFFKRIVIILFGNIAIISIGKFLLPNI